MATHTFIFLEDVIQQPDDPEALGFPEAWGDWTDVHYGMNPEVTGHSTYGPRMLEAMTSIPTVSLVMDMDDMFDPSTGSYANRLEKGFAWERPVSVELIYPNADLGFQINAGVRPQGGASRRIVRTPKASFRLLFKSEYDARRLEYPFFLSSGSDMADFNTITFRAEFNNEWLHPDNEQRERGLYMRDRFIRDSQIAVSGSGSHSKHVHLYINGVYWGLYNPSERIDAAFGSTYFGGEREDWDAYTHNGVRDGNRDAWDEMVAISNGGLSSLESYEAIQEYLDVPHYIDYMIVNLWVGMRDWPHNNWNAIRKREPGGQWLFYCWDSERSMESLNDERTNVSADAAQFYSALRQNSEFRLLFADHLQRHLFNGGALTPARTIPRFIQTAAWVGSAVIAESARWGSYRRDKACMDPPCLLYTRSNHWIPEFNRIVNDYLPQRTEIVIDQFRNRALYPNIAAPIFSPRGGTIQESRKVAMNSSDGPIYYTLNGDDPRVYGTGEISSSAIRYEEPFKVTEDTTIKARVLSNDQWSAIDEATFTAARAEPFPLSDGPYKFNEWSPDSPAGTYPAHMVFEQVQQSDPTLAVEMDGVWELGYDLTSRSRINGLGANGISFINTANAQDVEGAGYLGSAVLALATQGEENIRVQWTAGTVTPNSRVYGLRLQYRVGAAGAFEDVLADDGRPLEYIRSELAGHVQSFGPVTLPAAIERLPYVELRWKYYHVLGDSGPRAELSLDDILVASGTSSGATALVFETEPPATGQSGDVLTPLVVRAIDDQGLTDTSYFAQITLSLEGDGSLMGVTSLPTENGVAVFENLSIEVRRLGTGESESSGFYGDTDAEPRNFVLLYDNEEGTGRPLSATVVETTGAEVDARYAAFYLTQVAGRTSRWGTSLPNTLPSGVRRIEERSLVTDEVLAVHTFPSGLSGSINPVGGTNPTFANLQEGSLFLPVNDGSWGVAANWSDGAIPNDPDTRAIINMTAASDRTVLLNEDITLGSLILNNETAFRDRVDGGSAGSLTFSAGSNESILLAGRQGSGFHELRFEGGILLESDLRVMVDNVAADGEYGAVRIRELMHGPGALIKDGLGVMSLTGAGKNHTGATIIESGVLRVTESSQPRQTSGVHIAPGGQLRLVSHGEDREYVFGGNLTLNSLGPDEGLVALPQAGRLGALRLDPELEIRDSDADRHTATVTNSIEFIGDSHIHIDGTDNRLTLSGVLSGAGTLMKSGGAT